MDAVVSSITAFLCPYRKHWKMKLFEGDYISHSPSHMADSNWGNLVMVSVQRADQVSRVSDGGVVLTSWPKEDRVVCGPRSPEGAAFGRLTERGSTTGCGVGTAQEAGLVGLYLE